MLNTIWETEEFTNEKFILQSYSDLSVIFLEVNNRKITKNNAWKNFLCLIVKFTELIYYNIMNEQLNMNQLIRFVHVFAFWK